jgi:hypothetical protein
MTNEERKRKKKLREVSREERDRGRRVTIEYRKTQINGEWFTYMRWERRETEENILEEGEKKKRRTDEKRYKEKVNEKVDGQRKRKLEKKHKRESRYRKSTNGKQKVQKERRKREELPGE